MIKYFLIIIMLLAIACSEDPEGFDSDPSSDSDSDTDACDDILCDDPPDDECTEDGDLLAYTEEATCIEGECHYTYEIQECEWGCFISEEGDECGLHPCDGYVCDNPPDPECDGEAGNMLHVYIPEGGCSLDENNEPQCEYPLFIPEYCPFGCVEVPDGPDYCAEE